MYIYIIYLDTLQHKIYVRTVEPLNYGHFGTRYFQPFLLQYRGFPLSEVKNLLVTPDGTKIFVLIMVLLSP